MNNINEIVIAQDQTLRSAMELMTRSRKGVLLVLDTSRRLLGIISDGDIRRSILNEAIMMSPVSQIMNTDPLFGHSIDEAKELLNSKSLGVVPVINTSRELVAIVVEEEGMAKVFEMGNAETTFTDENILIIIPARGGSKRIPNKNLQKVGGYSLLTRAILVAQEAFEKATVIVSTDNRQIAQEAERMGINVPWLRPANLAADNTGSFEVVEHALSWATSNLHIDLETVILLEPTAPLRKVFHLKEAVALLSGTGADSVVGVCEIPHTFHPEEILRIKDNQLAPFNERSKMHSRLLRGAQEKLFVQNGIVYAFKPSTILDHRNLYGEISVPYVVDWRYFADIDEPIDLITAEAKLKF